MKELCIKDICKKDSSSLKQKELKETGQYPVYGASGIAGYLDSYHQESAYIGIVKDGSGIGRVSFYPERTSLIGTMQYILPKEGYDIRYIGYCLQSLDLSKYKQGAAIPHIYFRDYGERTVKVTDDINYQQRIVSRLDAAFAHIDELKANAEKQLSEARTLFQKALTKAMEPKEGWEEKKLGDIAKICLGLTHTPKYTESGVHFVSVKDISNGELKLEDTKFISKEEFDSMPSGAKPQKGDLLFCRVGTIGKPQILKTDTPFGIFVSVGFLRINDEVLTEYIKYWMDSPLFYKQVEDNVQGSTLKNLNTGWLKNFMVPIPPKKDIKRIVSRLDSLSAHVRELEEVLQKVITECDNLKQALLRKVFE